jgi:hypothetical protein
MTDHDQTVNIRRLALGGFPLLSALNTQCGRSVHLRIPRMTINRPLTVTREPVIPQTWCCVWTRACRMPRTARPSWVSTGSRAHWRTPTGWWRTWPSTSSRRPSRSSTKRSSCATCSRCVGSLLFCQKLQSATCDFFPFVHSPCTFGATRQPATSMAGVDFSHCHNVPKQPRGRVLSPSTASRGRQGSVPSSFHTYREVILNPARGLKGKRNFLNPLCACVKSSLRLDPSPSCPPEVPAAKAAMETSSILSEFSDGLYDVSVFGFCNESSNPRAIPCISLRDAYLNLSPRFLDSNREPDYSG